MNSQSVATGAIPKRTKPRTWFILAFVIAVICIARLALFTDASEIKDVYKAIDYGRYAEVKDVRGWFPLYENFVGTYVKIDVLYSTPSGNSKKVIDEIARDIDKIDGMSCPDDYGNSWVCRSDDGLVKFNIRRSGANTAMIFAESYR